LIQERTERRDHRGLAEKKESLSAPLRFFSSANSAFKIQPDRALFRCLLRRLVFWFGVFFLRQDRQPDVLGRALEGCQIELGGDERTFAVMTDDAEWSVERLRVVRLQDQFDGLRRVAFRF
jgi:hypothetical protein